MQSHRPCAYSASVKTLEGKSRSQSPSLYLRLATYSSSYCMGEYTLSRNDGQFRVCSAWLTFYPGLGADVSTSAQRSWRVRWSEDEPFSSSSASNANNAAIRRLVPRGRAHRIHALVLRSPREPCTPTSDTVMQCTKRSFSARNTRTHAWHHRSMNGKYNRRLLSGYPMNDVTLSPHRTSVPRT